MVPPAFSSSSSRRISGDALRVQPVGRLVQDQQPRPAHQRGGQSEPLPHAQRVRPGRPPVGRVQAHLLQHVADPVPAGAAAQRVGPGGVQQGEVRRAGQVRVGAGTLDQGADPRQHRTPGRRHRLAQHLGLARRRQHQPEQHPHRRGLARAVGAEEAVDVALGTSRSMASTARSSP